MNLFLVTFVLIFGLTAFAFVNAQNFRPHLNRFQGWQQPEGNCLTPNNYVGFCVPLSYCPFQQQFANRRSVQRYIEATIRICGGRKYNDEFLLCCANPTATSPTTKTVRLEETTAASIPEIINTSTTLTPAPTTAAAIPELPATSVIFPEALPKLNTTITPVQIKSITEATPTTTDEINVRALPTVEQHCGIKYNSLITNLKIRQLVGGTRARKNAWPWIALLHYKEHGQKLNATSVAFKCGGTLITARHVLTAAHCIRKNLDSVRLGEHDLSTDTETQIIDIPVVNKIPHPDYNKRTGRSDIAILYLQHNVSISDLIQPICLPYTNELQNKSFVNLKPYVAGWGRTMEGGSTSDILQQLQLPILENVVCHDVYKKLKHLFAENQFDNSIICAGELAGGKDTCQGDSGGPLMLPEKHNNYMHYYLIGIVSYGIGCARKDVPGVYTSTQYFMPWIREQVAQTLLVKND